MDLLTLAAAGARVLGYPHLHAKAIIADGASGAAMSANLQRHGLDQGVELGIRLDGPRLRSAHAVLSAWAERAPFALRVDAVVGDVLGDAHVWSGKQLHPWEVSETATVELGGVTAVSADNLDADPPTHPQQLGLPQPAHEVTVQWTVVAPRVAPKSKQVDANLGKKAKAGDPQAFRETGGRLVVAVAHGDEGAASAGDREARRSDGDRRPGEGTMSGGRTLVCWHSDRIGSSTSCRGIVHEVSPTTSVPDIFGGPRQT